MAEVRLEEVTPANLAAVRALRVGPTQRRFVGTVSEALDDAEAHPEGHPWYRAAYAGDEPVGFVMVSWNVPPRPPEIIGPWYLWKLLIDERHQGRGHGTGIIRIVADLVRREGATELLTSYVDAPDGPAGFYARVGFTPTGERDAAGEVIVRLPLAASA